MEDGKGQKWKRSRGISWELTTSSFTRAHLKHVRPQVGRLRLANRLVAHAATFGGAWLPSVATPEAKGAKSKEGRRPIGCMPVLGQRLLERRSVQRLYQRGHHVSIAAESCNRRPGAALCSLPGERQAREDVARDSLAAVGWRWHRASWAVVVVLARKTWGNNECSDTGREANASSMGGSLFGRACWGSVGAGCQLETAPGPGGSSSRLGLSAGLCGQEQNRVGDAAESG